MVSLKVNLLALVLVVLALWCPAVAAKEDAADISEIDLRLKANPRALFAARSGGGRRSLGKKKKDKKKKKKKKKKDKENKDKDKDKDDDDDDDDDKNKNTCTDLDQDGYCAQVDDCNDDDATIWPGAPELCDGLDNDCDGEVPMDELDSDGDGYSGPLRATNLRLYGIPSDSVACRRLPCDVLPLDNTLFSNRSRTSK